MGSSYKVLNRHFSGENNYEVFKELWKLKLPSKVSHFDWRLILDRLPTKVNLRRRNVDLNDVSCTFGTSCEEDVSHLFYSCDKIWPLWWEALSWLNIAVASPKSPREHFLQHSHGYLKGIRVQRWQTWWISLTWCICIIRTGLFSQMKDSTAKSRWMMQYFSVGYGSRIWKMDLVSLFTHGLPI